ncbi:hypothetical protein llap_5692 [Limosa lapponica baueri]|uniref:Uncharacterized protein n=1 Tax=Limosa lapponica baueri TaxID=1758121 RepID=A0A2I0UDC4_LIMLA|nr:hypothetical protein llap_5692 [Limosa lapponica baueri]
MALPLTCEPNTGQRSSSHRHAIHHCSGMLWVRYGWYSQGMQHSEKLIPTRHHCLKVVGQEVKDIPSEEERDDENEPQVHLKYLKYLVP